MKHINLKSIFATFLLLMGVCQVSWGRIIYLDTSNASDEPYKSATVWWAHIWNGTDGGDKSLEAVEGKANLYKVEIGTCTSIIFIPNNGVGNNWNAQTGDITDIPTDKNCYQIQNKQNGTWSTYGSSSCTSPTIAWQTAPANGTIGGTMTATVTTNQPSPAITWTSSNANAATVSDAGLITYKAAGTTTITAKYTGDGTTYCAQEVSVSKEITVEGLAQSEWKIKGTFDGWTDHNFTENGDNTCSYTYDLTNETANDKFQFVIYSGDTYYKGVDFTSSQPSATLKNQGNDAKITITTPGQYTFTWNYETKVLTVTYPGSTSTTYTVTFNDNGHGTAPASQTVNSGEKATKPADPTAEGYTFGGWYKEAACTTAYDFNTAVTKDITLYAQWTAAIQRGPYWYFDEKHTGWNGTIGDEWKLIDAGDYAYVIVPAYSGTDNKFKIFNCNPKDDNKVLANGSNIATGALAGDITLTAEGGEYNNIKIGATSTDYFVILYYPGTSLNSSSKYLVAASTVLPDAEKYPVTFGVVGNAGGTVSATSGGQAIESGDEVTVATFTAHPESGYGVEGWYSDAAGTSKIAAAGNATTYTQTITESNATVYVKFAKVYAIYFKPNDQNHWGSKWVYIFSESPWNGDKIQPRGKLLDHGQMAEDNGLYAYQIKAALGNDNYCFAFNWNDQSGNSDFYDCEAVYRGDFHKDMPVYISEQGQGMTEKKNDVEYYNKGVWMRYNDVEPGYDLGLRNQTDDNANMVFHRFKAGSIGGYVSTVSVTLEENKTYSFLVKNDKPYYYHVSSETTCTPDANHFALYQQEDAAYQHEVVIKPTITGIYTFQLNLANGKAEIDVLYPSTNYRLVYAEVAGGKCVKFHPSSPYIKVIDGEATQDIVSLHVRCSIPDFAKDDLGHTTQITGWTPNTNSRYVYLQKTEDGNTWTTVDTKDITASVTKNGVYNFVVEQDEAGTHIGESITEYTGNYYIRTNLADGGWNNYTAESNRFTYSDYAAKNRYFDHYWCKYHNGGNIDLSFVVANDYSLCVSDTCVDEMDSRDFTTDGIFDKQANIRFSYSSEANTTDRAYIAGAGNNLWLLTKDGKITCDNTQFSDRGNWVYYLDVTAQPEAMIGLQKKPYNGAKDDYFVIGSNADNCSHKLLTGTGRNNYHVRILYDFKSDHLIYGWMPDENETIEGELPLDASVIFVRVGHGQANQLSFKNKEGKDGAVIKVDEALGVLTINKNDYLNKPNPFKRDYYWISFPFDVEVSDIFSAFVLNKHFWIQEYDGASRALHGCFADSPTYWKSLGKGDRLHKGQGYVVYLEHDAILKDNLYAHTDALSLYFPSNGLTEINGTPMEVTVPEHKCTITKPYDRTVYDSNWNLIGVAAWADISALSDIHRDNPEYTDVLHISGDQKVGFYYHLNTGEEGKTPNTWTPMQAEQADGTNFEETFQTMYSYLVQWYGTITWTATVTFNEPGKQALQARRAPGQETKEYTLRLECGRADAMPDQTFVRLQEEGEVTADYDVNYDMTKMLNAGCTNIYSLIGDRRIQAGANVMPLPAENTTVYVPLGVVADKDGTYRFSMPDGTEGMTVLLADYETGMTYNLALGDYEVPLTAGTYEQRFVLEIQPKKNIVTGCNESKADDAPLRKVLIDGNLYIQRGKELYNISGAHL
ncbi:MAG: InlB B-repeat-containing protein [Paludibacteraceae bacterium]